MIDLRSDTLTTPTKIMREAMYNADVGDSGRMDSKGRGEDPTLNTLEDMASEITGKESSVYVPSGTIGNLVSLLAYCSRGDQVAVEENIHIYRSEKGAFTEKIAGLIPVLYSTDRFGRPIISSIKKLISNKKVKLLCIENTHNFSGGTCLFKEDTNKIASVARKNRIPVHMDGARIFNASVSLKVPVRELVKSVDSVMFCLSKGLGAPVGSLLCGSFEFILEAKKILKQLGGVMRQAGIVAAAGIIALRDEIERLEEDHLNAKLLSESIVHNEKINLDLQTVQTNIVMVDVSPSGKDVFNFKTDLERGGLKVHAMSKKHIRMVTYRGIKKKNIIKAANIFNKYCDSITYKS